MIKKSGGPPETGGPVAVRSFLLKGTLQMQKLQEHSLFVAVVVLTPPFTLYRTPCKKIIIMLQHGQLGPAATAPFSEQILPAFDGQLQIRVAYSWSRDTVLTPNGPL